MIKVNSLHQAVKSRIGRQKSRFKWTQIIKHCKLKILCRNIKMQ